MNAVLAALVPLGFFGLVGLSIFYVDAQLRRLFRLPGRWVSRTSLAVLVFGALVAIGLGATSSNALMGVAYVAGGYVFTLYLYLTLTVVCIHLLLRVWQRSVPVARAAALVVPVVATVVGGVQAGQLTVRETRIQLAKVNRPIDVMLVTDVHLGHHRGREYLQHLVKLTNARDPDLVLIAGDFVDANIALEASVFEPLRAMRAPVFYVGGNHEKEIDDGKGLSLLAEQGVHVLHNQVVIAKGLQLVGLDYMKPDEASFDMHPSKDPRTIQGALATMKLDPALATVLMHHSPVGSRYAADAGVDLMVAGHTHGGQLFPATLITAAIFPFNQGLYREGKLQVFVSKGAGTFLQRVRLGSANEIDLLHIEPAR